jgi:hypothetical protein
MTHFVTFHRQETTTAVMDALLNGTVDLVVGPVGVYLPVEGGAVRPVGDGAPLSPVARVDRDGRPLPRALGPVFPNQRTRSDRHL